MLLIEESRTLRKLGRHSQARTNNALQLTSSQDYQGIVRARSSRSQLSFIR